MGLDFRFECPSFQGTGPRGVLELGSQVLESLGGIAKAGNLRKGSVAGDKVLPASKVFDEGIEAGVLGNDVEIAFWMDGDQFGEFASEDEVECAFPIAGILDELKLARMILGEQHERGGQTGLLGADDQEDPHRPVDNPGEVGFTHVLVVDKDVSGACSRGRGGVAETGWRFHALRRLGTCWVWRKMP